MKKILKFVLPAFFLQYSYVAYAVIAVTQITHASVETDITGFTYNCDGAIDITANGNAGPFTFQWNDGVVSEDRSQLCSGWYTVTVTNAFGCSKILDAYIKSCQYDPVQITGHKITPIDLTTFKGGINIELNMSPQGLISDSRSFNGVILSGNNGPLSVYPNPFTNLINLVFQSESAGAGKISLFDITGQLIKNQPLQVSSGENTIAMNLADSISRAGFFLLKLETPDGSTHIVKIIRKPD